MATATFLKGTQTTIEWVGPTSGTTAVGTIVIVGTNDNRCIGVTLNAIPASTTGIVDITGCYVFPKATGAAIKAGESVDWDASISKVEDNQSTCVTGDIANFAVALADAAAGSTSNTVKIMLDPNKDVT
jgi:predicted RecA/RadA family phage recombinase